MFRHVIITVDDAHLDRLDQVTTSLRSAGLQLEQVLAPLGLITGCVDPARAARLRQVPGVAAVEDDGVKVALS